MWIPSDSAATLLAVVDAGTLDAAATRLGVTPSAVSQRLRALERSVGRVLLVRSRPARATAAGEVVVRLARQQALLEHEALVELGADEGAVTIAPLAVNADSLATWFLAPLARVAARRPVSFEVHRDDQDLTVALLESGRVMAAVTSRADPVAGCRVSALGAMRYEAVATPDLVRRFGDEPGRMPVVVFDAADDLQDRWLREQGLASASAPRHLIPSSEDFAAAVRTGLGWGMLPAAQSATALAEGSLVRRGGEPVDVDLYWQQWDLRSALLDDVTAEVAREARGALAPPVR